MTSSYKAAQENYDSCERQDETTKKGVCLLEVRRTGMVQWGFCRPAESVDQAGENNLQIPSTIVKEEQKDDEASESLVLPEMRKRKRLTLIQLREARAARHTKWKQSSMSNNCAEIKHENSTPTKKESSKDRWSADRFKLAEKHMLEVMRAEGAVFENPISRTALRMAARKHIGDTGLLDHLLKHIDGKVAPGGTERFRRCYNTEGIMEYWLESADLVKIKHEAGVPDPNWVPPSWWKPGGVAFKDSVFAGELSLLKEEIAKMKRNMQELLSKNQDQDQSNQIGMMYKELVKWRGETDKRLMEISNSLSGMQDMYRELMAWKAQTEQQLMDISNSLSSMQTSKQCTTLSPASERWEEWLESTNFVNIQGEDFAPWLESTDLGNVRLDASVQEPHSTMQPWLKPCDSSPQDPVCARELELLKEEMAKMKRDMQELVPKKTEEDQTNMTPDSSTTANSKFELDNSFLLFQEMLKEWMKWKAKIDKQMQEISNSVSTLQASRQYII